MREISLSPSENPTALSRKTNLSEFMTLQVRGVIQISKGDVTKGLPALRRDWILGRDDIREYSGRESKPEDNGYLSRNTQENTMRTKMLKIG